MERRKKMDFSGTNFNFGSYLSGRGNPAQRNGPLLLGAARFVVIGNGRYINKKML